MTHKALKQSGASLLQAVTWTLEAERMSREQLYQRLAEWSYSWHPRIGKWI